MTPIEQAKAALEFIQHLHSCEDEGMASGQPSRDDYLKARDLTDSALSSLSTIEGSAEPEYVGWYCAHCERGVDGSEVTYHEQHEVCGRVVSNDRPPKRPSLSVDEAMEAMALHYFEYHQQAIGHAGNPLYDSLRERLTKAITRS